MKLRTVLSAAFLALTLFTSAPAEAAKTSPENVVKNFYSSLLITMKQGPKLGYEGRKKKLAPVIKKSYNMALMTRYSVGPKWKTATKAQQKGLVKAFTDFSVSTYASRFKKFDNEKFEVLGSKPVGKKSVMVETHLTPEGDDPVKLNYLLRKDKKGTYRIADVYLDASISELAMRRSDFSAVIKRNGIDAIVTSLKAKVATMKKKSTN